MEKEMSDLSLNVGAEAIEAYNSFEEAIWNDRPICCGQKVSAFDDGAYICQKCERIFEP